MWHRPTVAAATHPHHAKQPQSKTKVIRHVKQKQRMQNNPDVTQRDPQKIKKVVLGSDFTCVSHEER